MNTVSLSLQEKQLKVLITSNNIRYFKPKSEFWKTCIHHHEQYLKIFSGEMRLVMILANVNFFLYCIMKCLTTWRIFIIQ